MEYGEKLICLVFFKPTIEPTCLRMEVQMAEREDTL